MQAEITVIGGGPGGYVAAIRAAQQGKDVVLVEAEAVGGVCLNHGCIPTKVLKRSAEAVKNIDRSNSFGIEVENYTLNFDRMMERKNRIVDRLTGGVDYLLDKHGVKVVEGEGIITSSRQVTVKNRKDEKKINTSNIIIATGSEPLIPDIVGIDQANVLTSREFLQLDKIPDTLAVVGGGYIGVEFASIFSQLGSQVTLIEMLPEILPTMDADLSSKAEETLKKELDDVLTEAKVEKIISAADNKGRVELVLDKDENLNVEKVLMATGRKANVPEIAENLNVNFDDEGNIQTNEYLQTGEDNIYAIGDVIGNYQLAHVASREGIIAVSNILGKTKKMDYKVVPSVVFSLPEIASVGLTESEAVKKYEIEVGTFPYQANGKALAEEEKEGFVKVISDEHWDEILGIHIYGKGASDLIGEAAVALQLECTSEELAGTIHAHPTLAEMVMEAAEDVEGLAIHKP